MSVTAEFPGQVRPFLTAEQIQQRVAEMGQQITADYAGKRPMLVGVLKGSFIFMADLARAIDAHVTCDFLRVSSYGDRKTSSGEVRFEFDTTQPMTGKDIILVEDIIDSGLTASYLMSTLTARKPASLRIASLLHKKVKTVQEVRIDYLGFEIPDHFVIGYGLDYAGLYRNLPYIGILEEDLG